jgi:hypothetical protein
MTNFDTNAPMISGKPKGELYISVDVETSGGGPLTQNLLSIGAVVVGDHSLTHYVEIAPLKSVRGYDPDPQAMKVHGLDLSRLKKEGKTPMRATTEFKSWVFDTAGARRPVFVSFGTYDWMWCGSYFDLYGGRYTEPFGPNTLDLKCLAPGTLILCADLTWKPIEQLVEGEEVVGFDESTPRTVPRRLRRAKVYSNPLVMLPAVRVQLTSGKSFVCSEDHAWLTCRFRSTEHGTKWRTANKLIIPNQISPAQLIHVFHPWKADESWESGYIAGMVDGEGSTGAGGRRIGVGQGEDNYYILQRLGEALKQRDFTVTIGPEHPTSSGKMQRGFAVCGGIAEQMRFAGTFRAEKLLKKLRWEDQPWQSYRKPIKLPRLGRGRETPYFNDSVVSVTPIGVQPLYALATSTGTYFADGYASHNSFYAGWRGRDFTRAAKRFMPAHHLSGTRSSHNALEDAIQQAEMFEQWLVEMHDDGRLGDGELKKLAKQLIGVEDGS